MTNQRQMFLTRQNGGTIIGFILGLIVGLAIALGVAMAITKSSLPFLNKVAKQDKASELTPGQTSDPNKPMYGNNAAAKEAAKDLAPANGTADNKTATPATGQGAATPAQPATAPATTDAKPADAKPAEVAKSIDQALTAKPDAADDKWTYFLQAGAFRDQADADNSKAKLALAGFEANISERTSDTGPLYRVRIGPFNQLEAMNRVRGKLSDNGIDVAVVRIAK